MTINQKPFEGDTFIPKEIKKIKRKFGVDYCIETGTQYGTTTLSLTDIFKVVFTIEADEEYYKIALERLNVVDNTFCMFGKSEDLLKKVINLCQNKQIFFYLDAHGCNIGGCALKKELEIIANYCAVPPCIAIHDFKVPGKDFGFDTYDYALEWGEIKEYVEAIYKGKYDYYYNEEANGANRGIIYITPK